MDNFEEQELGGLPILKKETPSQEESGGLPILKKKEPTPLASSVTPLPYQDKFKQGLAFAQEGYKSPIASAVKKDIQKEESTTAAIYNTLVGSVKRLAGGAAYMAEVGGLMGGRPEAAITRLASAEQARQKTEQFVEKARSEKASKEYEQQLKQFDVTPQKGGGLLSGIDANDFKALAFQAPSQALDMLLGSLTGGGTFVAQSISDAANELNQSGADTKLNDAEKATYIFTQAAAQAALEKYGLDKILKNTGLGKAAKQKIANEITDEFVKKGVKATADDIVNAATKKASSFASVAKRVGVKTAVGIAAEGGTEGAQTAAQEGIKLLTNKIVDKDVFNEDDIIANLGKNIINSSVAGGAFGSMAGAFVGGLQNTNKAIRDEVAKAGKKFIVDGIEVSEDEFNAAIGNKKVVSDITNIQNEINKQVEEGNITPQEAEAANITAQQYAEIAGKIPTTISPQDKYKIIGGIEQREALNAQKQQVMNEMTDLDPVFKKEKQDQIDLIQAKIDETNNYLEGIVSGKKPQYKEKRGMYFKVDSEGQETPISKETYDLATSIREEDARKAETAIDDFANRIASGEKMESPEDLQFYENNKKEIEKALQAKADKTKPTVVMPEANVAPEVAETVVTEEKVKPTEFVEKELDKDEKQLYKNISKVNIGGEEYNFTEPSTTGEGRIFTIEHNGKEIGKATLSVKYPNEPNYLDNIKINEEYRRKGLATKLYDYIEHITGEKLEPSPIKQSEAAKKLWGKRIKPEVEKVPFISSQKNTVELENGNLIVKDKSGNVLSDRASKKALEEYAENFNYSIGERVSEIPSEITNERDSIKYAIDNTKNPLEVVEVYVNEQPLPFEGDAKMQAIAEYGLGRIKTSSYKRHGDPNKIEKSMYLNIFSEERGLPIDVLAKSISDKYDINIEPKDIVDYIEKYPKGDKKALELQETDIQLRSKDKFKELTGLNLTPELANKIFDKELEKANKDQLDIIKQDYETAQQLEDAYWKAYAETDGFTKESSVSKIDETKPTTEEKQVKKEEYAIQKPSPEGVFQYPQEGVGETRSERRRMERAVKREEAAGKSQEVTPAKSVEKKQVERNEKSILKKIYESENISESVKEKFKDDLKYKTASQAEAKKIAKEIIKEYGYDEAVKLAEENRFADDVNTFLFSESVNEVFLKERDAQTPEEKAEYAEQWADYARRFDEAMRGKGRAISAIYDFVKKSPLGIVIAENRNRNENFKKWLSNKEENYKELFNNLINQPEFKEIISEEVQKEIKKERSEARKEKRQKIEDFFDNAKLKGNNLYAVPIPVNVINGALEVMKQAVLAGESISFAVEQAISHISKEVSDWDKEKFRNEYVNKLSSFDSYRKVKDSKEISDDKSEKYISKFRKKLSGLNENQSKELVQKSFKKLVENGALEYDDFKKIVADVAGFGELNSEQIEKITDLVEKVNKVDEFYDLFEKEENITPENLSKYKKAKKEGELASTELSQLINTKISIVNRLLSMVQLGTLGSASLALNVAYNVTNQALLRFPIGVQLSVLDKILYGTNLLKKNEFLPENDIAGSQKEFFRKGWQGTKMSVDQLFTGLTNKDYFQKELPSSQIHPFTSAKELFDWSKGKKALTKEQVADKVLQASPGGIVSAVIARLLNIGDKPLRFAAEGAKSASFANALGLKGLDREFFIEMPKQMAYIDFKKKGFSDDIAMQKAEEVEKSIIKSGEEAVFQQDNLITAFIEEGIQAVSKKSEMTGAAIKIVKTLNMPYLKTPLNVAWSIYNLINPEIAVAQSVGFAFRAYKTKSPLDVQASKKWLAHAVTGAALMAIAGALSDEEIINANNGNKTSRKERKGEQTYEQQNSLNITKLMALINGEDPNKVENSLNVDLKWFGAAGNILNLQATKLDEMTKEQRKDNLSFTENLLMNLDLSTAEMVENGVFSNSASLMQALTKGGGYGDAYVLNLINLGANVIQPAVFAQMSRAQLPYYSEIKADSFLGEVKNNALARSGLLRSLTGAYPPSKVGVWGDTLERNDNLAMKIFGISSSNKDNFAQPLYEDYKRTNNIKFLPPSSLPEINNIKLDASKAKQFEILVGKARKTLITPFVNDGAILRGFNNKYSNLNDEQKINALEVLYKQGYENAKNEFIKLYPEFYKPSKKTKEEKKESRISRIFRRSIK